MAKMLQKGVVMATLAAALLLTGCGNRMPAASPVDAPAAASESPAAIAPAPVVTQPVAPVAPANPAYQAPISGSLVVSNISKTKKGLLFKKMVVKGSVVNTSQVALSGTVKIVFKESKGIFTKTLEEVETKTIAVANLAPGGTFPIDVTSDETGVDEVEVTVETTPGAAAPAAANAYGAPGAAAYGAPGATGSYGY